ncbi:MAG: fumarylacetoacetate hydrolase family protein [Akkermansiaceae bacterium]|nr:fumarylacetoacetate hydrolase family protein [Akkermansiaceae bacterium]
MRLATLRDDEYGDEFLAWFHQDHFISVENAAAVFGAFFPTDFQTALERGEIPDMIAWWNREADERLPRMPEFSVHKTDTSYGPLYRRPRKIWGIGLNYAAHASDLDESAPTAEPASFMKPDTALIGHGDPIRLPALSERVTGEGELAIVIGRECRDVPREDWLSAVAGFTNVLDMTAEDILRRNPRNLTQAKAFDTFFSFGPVFLSPDEIPDGDFGALTVQTVLNGEIRAENTVANMTFPLDFLVAHHSRVMTLLPGDIISTGTPGATVLAAGDTLECRILGAPFEPLVNPVVGSAADGEDDEAGT